MRKQTRVALIASLALILAAVTLQGIGSAAYSGATPNEPRVGGESKKSGNGFGRVIKAPFKALAKLFGGGKDDKKIRRLSEEDVRKLEAANVTRFVSADATDGPRTAESTDAAPPAPSAIVSLEQGRMMLDRERLEDAIGHLSKAASADPKLGQAHHLLGVAFARKGLTQLARNSFERAARLSPDDARLFNDYGYMLYASADYEGAVKRLKRAVKLAPGNNRAWNNLALAQFRRGDYDDALKSFGRAGGEFTARMNVAGMLVRAGREGEAVKHYEAARRLNPTSKEALVRLADLYQRSGRPHEAEAARKDLAEAANAAVVAKGN